MQYVIIARDDTADGNLERRLENRHSHLEKIHAMKADGSIIDGGALLDDDNKMIGSVILCEFDDRAALNAYVQSEVYFTAGVWKHIEIIPFRRVAWNSWPLKPREVR